MKNLKPIRWLKQHRFGLAVSAGLAVLAVAGLMFYADQACSRVAAGRLFRSTADVPERSVGLVLGTGKQTRRGAPNPHFEHRIAAAAALYHAGKVRHLLVSGDNHVAAYDEPDDMRAALIAAGVPASAITCDYAGFHTLDSVVRAREVFGLNECTIITEEFHCPRALWIAGVHGVDAIAYAAPDVSGRRWSLRADTREQFARAWCALDLHLLHRGPKFLGPKEPILLTDTTH